MRTRRSPGERNGKAPHGVPEELALLPPAPDGEWLIIRDSHDVTGFNDDGFSGAYSYQYKSEKGWVLFDHKGPGYIALIRTIGFRGKLRIYLEDGPEAGKPWKEIPFRKLHSGHHADFPQHLVCSLDRGHGCEWCYLPIPFLRRCVIAAEEDESASLGPHFYSIWAKIYRQGCGDLPSLRDRIPRISSGWTEPWRPAEPDGFGSETARGEASLLPFRRVTLLERRGAGMVAGLRLRIEEPSPSVLRSLFIRAYWDRKVEERESTGWESGMRPQVDAPVGLFFAKGYSTARVGADASAGGAGSYTVHHGSVGDQVIPLGSLSPRSPAVGEADDGILYCCFPMPFRQNALLELVNLGEEPAGRISWELFLEANPYPPDAGHFCAFYRRENGTLDHRDYAVADVQGTGRYVGCVMRMSSRQDPVKGGFQRGFLEGDARFYADEKRSFEPGSTGTEEYFNWGWYDMLPHDGPFTFPTHGYTEHTRDINDHSTMYRFHFTDGIPYYRCFRFDIEHGPHGTWPSDYESVAFLYHRDQPVLFLTDHLDMGSEESRRRHGYRAEGICRKERRTLPFEGNAQVKVRLAGDRRGEETLSLEGLTGDVESCTGDCTFTVAVRKGNAGVKLRKRFDGDRAVSDKPPDPPAFMPVLPPQEAAVVVDDEEAGVWYLPSRITRGCWIEEDFEIPGRFTGAKERLTVSLRPRDGSRWSSSGYWVFTYLPADPSSLGVDASPGDINPPSVDADPSS